MMVGYIDELRKKVEEFEENVQLFNELDDKLHTAKEQVDAAVGQKDELLAEIKTLRTNIIKIKRDFDIDITGMTREKNKLETDLVDLKKKTKC